jgi:hypothetical protein
MNVMRRTGRIDGIDFILLETLGTNKLRALEKNITLS